MYFRRCPLGQQKGTFAWHGHAAPHSVRYFVDYTKNKPIHTSPHKRSVSQGVSKTGRGIVSGGLVRPHNPGAGPNSRMASDAEDVPYGQVHFFPLRDVPKGTYPCRVN